MQVLLIGPTARAFGVKNFQWFAYTARALRRLGHRVAAFGFHESWAASPSVTRGVGSLPGCSRWWQRYLQAQVRARDRRLVRLARRLRPDVVLVLKSETLSGEVLAELKRLTKGSLVTWWVDDPWRAPQFVPSLKRFDHVFVFDRSYLPRLAAAGVRRAHFLPCACDETVYRPLHLGAAQRRRFQCHVALVGWYFPERGPIVRALAGEIDLGVWGGGWRSPEAQAILGEVGAAVIRGGAVSDETAATIYNASEIGLNVHQRQSRLGGLNTRTFEVLASGLFELVDRVEGLEELLQPGVEVVCYDSPDQLRQLAKHYLNDAGARVRIAAKGRVRVLDEHTYTCRMRRLCELARAA